MSIIGDGIMLGVGGEKASIFVTGLSETDTVTATKDGKTITGKWVNVLSPLYHALPDGYTQLEYIESTGTQYIDTGVLASDIKDSFIDFQFVSVGDTELEVMAVYVDSSNKMQCGWSGSAFMTTAGATYSQTASSTARTIATVIPVGSPAYSVYLFAQNEKGTVKWQCSAKIYSCRMKTSAGLVRNFIPTKRNSDGVVGLYDLVNGVFYTNSGTGTFTAGKEIPQYIDCFKISPIKSYSTWAVTATDGTKTATSDILIDSANVFDLFIKYNKVKNGNFINGYDNWSFEGTGSSTYRYKDLIPHGEGNYLRIGTDTDSTYSAVQTVDFTGASELSFYADFVSGTSSCTFLVFVGSTVVFSAAYGDTIKTKSIPISYSGNQTLKFTAKKTDSSGNSVRVNITDIYVY